MVTALLAALVLALLTLVIAAGLPGLAADLAGNSWHNKTTKAPTAGNSWHTRLRPPPSRATAGTARLCSATAGTKPIGGSLRAHGAILLRKPRVTDTMRE